MGTEFRSENANPIGQGKQSSEELEEATKLNPKPLKKEGLFVTNSSFDPNV